MATKPTPATAPAAKPTTAKATPAAKAPAGITVAQLAEQLGTSPRALRAFLRSTERGTGRGSRYEFTKAQAATVTKAWNTRK